MEKRDGKWKPSPKVEYRVPVYRNGHGEIGKVTVTRPQSKAPWDLSPRMIGTLARKVLGER